MGQDTATPSIDDLRAYFKAAGLSGEMQLDSGTKIVDVHKLLEAQFAILKSGRAARKPQDHLSINLLKI